MIKKLFAFVLLTIIFCCIFSLSCFAHSGMTDSHGGHYVGGTSNYHYHCGGHPAHQHENGVCPYDRKESSFDWLTTVAAVVVIGPIIIVVIIWFVTFLIEKIKSSFKEGKVFNKTKTAVIYASTKTIEELENEIEELNNEKADIVWVLNVKTKNNRPQAEIEELTCEKERVIARIETLEKEKQKKLNSQNVSQ